MTEEQWKTKMEDNLLQTIENGKRYRTVLNLNIVSNVLISLAMLIYILS